MLLFPVFLATSFWSCADMQSVPVQTPELQNQMKGTSASLSCQLRDKTVVHWYRQLPGEPPKRILYVSGGAPIFDDSNDRNRFQVRNDPTQPIYGLTINSLTPRDSGIYYCAYWFYQGTTALAGQRQALQKDSLCSEPQALNSAKIQILPYSTTFMIFCSRRGKTTSYEYN